jgi:hypothetical protein
VITQLAAGTASGAANKPTIEVATANMAIQHTQAKTTAIGLRRTVSVSSVVAVTRLHLIPMPGMYRSAEHRVAGSEAT